MSQKKAKKIRKALFKKGIPATTGKYFKDHGTGIIYAGQERRIYKALKQRPLKEALDIIEKLKPTKRPENVKR
jgi:hypothetical protein